MNPMSIGTEIAFKQLQGKADASGKADPVAQAPGEVLHSFGQILEKSLNHVNSLQQAADKASETYAVGGPIQLHQVMIAAERAQLSLELASKISSKVVQAYQDISRMGV